MEWNSETLDRLSVIFGSKSREIMRLATLDLIVPDMDAEHVAYDKAWTAYLLGLGLRMEPLVGIAENRSSFVQGDKVRIVNAWGDRYIDVPEDLALKTLMLGFLP